MKLLTVSILLWALLALSCAADSQGETAIQEPGHVAKRATSCPGGWTLQKSRCFRYFSSAYTWAEAEKYCTLQGGNLASAPTNSHYDWLRSFIKRRAGSYKTAWIGGSDAQQERVWLWSDGSRFIFRDWCNSRPYRSTFNNCLAMNYPSSNCYCGIDLPCKNRYPFVCVRK